MLSAPTDKLYKFWAIVGLGLLAFGVLSTIDSFDKRGSAFVVASDKMDPANRAMDAYFERANELFEQARIYSRDPNKEGWEKFDRYRTEHWGELERLQAAASLASDEHGRDIRAAEHMLFMSKIRLWLGMLCIACGAVLTFVGFRNWVRKEA